MTTKPIYQEIPISDLRTNYEYQRALSMDRVRRIARDFDPSLLGVALVSKDNGHYNLFDGNHRKHALELLGVTRMPCLVYNDLTTADEAHRFVMTQSTRSNVTLHDQFRANLVAGDAVTTAINRVVVAEGFSVAPKSASKTANGIRSIRELRRLYAAGGEKLISRTLKLIRETWGVESDDARSHAMIGGIGNFLTIYGDQVSDAEFANKLKGFKPISMISDAFSVRNLYHHNTNLAMVAQVTAAYNKGRRTRHLDDSQLLLRSKAKQ